MEKLIITAAVVGAEVMREDNPHIPYTPTEIAMEVVKAYEAGAAIAHIHARKPDGQPTQDAALYQEIINQIRDRCDIIIQVSTGGAVGMSATERLQPLRCQPEMATLSTGSVNFGQSVFLNEQRMMEQFATSMMELGIRPEFEIFEAGMLANALNLVKRGFVTGHLHFDFVMGVPGAMPAHLPLLLHMKEQLPEAATWTVAGIGRHQLPLATHAILLGGHVRVGFEDNIYYRKGELATSNGQLVARIARLAKELGRSLATPDEARTILGIEKTSFKKGSYN